MKTPEIHCSSINKLLFKMVAGLLFLVSFSSALLAASAAIDDRSKDENDPRAEILGKSAIELVVFAEAMNIAIKDTDVGPNYFRAIDVSEIMTTEIAPVVRIIERERPLLLTDSVSTVLATIAAIPQTIQADGKPLAAGIYEAEKKRYLGRFGAKGLAAALVGRFETKVHNRRKIIKTIEASFNSPKLAIRGEDFCGSAIVIGAYAAMSNYGAARPSAEAKVFTTFVLEDLLNKHVRPPFRALSDAASRDSSVEGEKARNARLVERIIEQISELKNSNKDIEASYEKEWKKAVQSFEGNDLAAATYMAVMIETVIEICAEKLCWVIKYPVYSTSGLDWSSLKSHN